MKRVYFLLFTLLLCIPFFAQEQETFRFTSPLDGWADTIYITYDKTKEETCVRKNGMFDFSLPLNHVTTIDIADCNYGIKIDGDPKIDRFIAVPGEHLIVKSLNNYTGSPFYKKYSKAQQLVAGWGYNESTVDSIESYVKTHLDDEISIILLTDWRYPPLSVNKSLNAFAMFSPKLRNGRMGIYFHKMMKIRAKQEEEIRQKSESVNNSLQKGIMAPDFRLKDSNGIWRSLRDLRGKYVLLDFWGTWCVACQMCIPDLKKFAARNSENTVVISLACYDKERRWRACIAKNEMNWINILVPESSDILDNYKVNKFPSMVYISPEGKIIDADFTTQKYADSPI